MDLAVLTTANGYLLVDGSNLDNSDVIKISKEQAEKIIATLQDKKETLREKFYNLLVAASKLGNVLLVGGSLYASKISLDINKNSLGVSSSLLDNQKGILDIENQNLNFKVAKISEQIDRMGGIVNPGDVTEIVRMGARFPRTDVDLLQAFKRSLEKHIDINNKKYESIDLNKEVLESNLNKANISFYIDVFKAILHVVQNFPEIASVTTDVCNISIDIAGTILANTAGYVVDIWNWMAQPKVETIETIPHEKIESNYSVECMGDIEVLAAPAC